MNPNMLKRMQEGAPNSTEDQKVMYNDDDIEMEFGKRQTQAILAAQLGDVDFSRNPQNENQDAENEQG